LIHPSLVFGGKEKILGSVVKKTLRVFQMNVFFIPLGAAAPSAGLRALSTPQD
jgi:hypothetical protein